MVFSPFGANPLFESKLTYCQLDPYICGTNFSEISIRIQHWPRQWLVASSAPIQYLIQFGLIINWNLTYIWNKLQWNFNLNATIFIWHNSFEIDVSKISVIVFGIHLYIDWLIIIIGSSSTWVNCNALSSCLLKHVVLFLSIDTNFLCHKWNTKILFLGSRSWRF